MRCSEAAVVVCPPESDGSKTHLLVDDTLAGAARAHPRPTCSWWRTRSVTMPSAQTVDAANGFVYLLSTKPASTQLAKSSGLGLPASVTTRLMSRLCSGILTSKRHGSWERRITGLSDARAPSMYTRN